MRKHPKMRGVVPMAILVTALLLLVLAGTAQAKLTGEFAKFQYCPYTNAEVRRCIYSVTNGGEVVLGNKKVTIEKEVVLQGGYTKSPFEGEPEEKISKFVAATNGITLSKAAQNVPGGLLGIVPDEKSPALVKALIKFFFENSLTGVTSTLELAKPASDIRISETNLAEGIGVALKMPVKVHLENPFLGKSCFVGSSTSPITLELTTGTTSPPGPNTPITGVIGEVEFLEEARILKLKGNELVDNAWSAPAASGCGGILSFLVNPIINGQIGLPAASGKNTARLKNTVMTTTALALKINNEEHP
jgi:hypothetical protein